MLKTQRDMCVGYPDYLWIDQLHCSL